MQDFMEYCHQNALPLDFVTRHFYTFDTPDEDGHYSYGALRDPDESLMETDRSRAIIDSFPEYRGLPMHITEFNTSYRPDSPVHDTTRNAAYVARLLARLGEVNDSYSYWTFGDVFEEMGFPSPRSTAASAWWRTAGFPSRRSGRSRSSRNCRAIASCARRKRSRCAGRMAPLPVRRGISARRQAGNHAAFYPACAGRMVPADPHGG